MAPRRYLLLGLSIGLIGLGIGCGGSSYRATSAPPPPPAPPAFVASITDLVKNHTSDSEAPASLDSLKLDGADMEDIHEFDTLLGI